MPGTIGERLSNSWVVLAALFFGRMCMGLQVQSVAALTPFLVTGLGLSYSEIGLLSGSTTNKRELWGMSRGS